MPKATYEISCKAGTTTVCASRDYPPIAPPTAQRVWEIVADFGRLKTILPSLVRIYLTYPDAKETAIGTVRDMTFVIPNSENPLSNGIEKLVELDEQARRLEYISLTGLPVTDYQSVMEVAGEDACTLTWTSTFKLIAGQEASDFPEVLGGVLAGGADQIAKALSLEL